MITSGSNSRKMATAFERGRSDPKDAELECAWPLWQQRHWRDRNAPHNGQRKKDAEEQERHCRLERRCRRRECALIERTGIHLLAADRAGHGAGRDFHCRFAKGDRLIPIGEQTLSQNRHEPNEHRAE